MPSCVQDVGISGGSRPARLRWQPQASRRRTCRRPAGSSCSTAWTVPSPCRRPWPTPRSWSRWEPCYAVVLLPSRRLMGARWPSSSLGASSRVRGARQHRVGGGVDPGDGPDGCGDAPARPGRVVPRRCAAGAADHRAPGRHPGKPARHVRRPVPRDTRRATISSSEPARTPCPTCGRRSRSRPTTANAGCSSSGSTTGSRRAGGDDHRGGAAETVGLPVDVHGPPELIRRHLRGEPGDLCGGPRWALRSNRPMATGCRRRR